MNHTGHHRVAFDPPVDGISQIYLLVPRTSSFGHPSLIPISGDAEQDATAVAEWAVARLVPRKSTGLLRALAAAASCEDPDEPFRSSTLVSVGLPICIRNLNPGSGIK